MDKDSGKSAKEEVIAKGISRAVVLEAAALPGGSLKASFCLSWQPSTSVLPWSRIKCFCSASLFLARPRLSLDVFAAILLEALS